MTRQEADELIEEAKKFLGRTKPVVTDGLLGFPSNIEVCRFDEAFLFGNNGDFFPMAKMISVKTGSVIKSEDLRETLKYLRYNER